MLKGITPIIGIILLVLITISLVGTAYTFIFGIAQSSASKTIKIAPGSENENTLIIENLGTDTLNTSELTIQVNGQQASIEGFQLIQPGNSALVTFENPVIGKNLNVRVTGASNPISYTVSIPCLFSHISNGDGTCTAQFSLSPTGDGDIQSINVVWATARNANTGTANNSNQKTTVQAIYVGLFGINRGFLPFNTSSLPDNAEILSGKIAIYVESIFHSGNGPDFVALVESTQQSATNLVGADFNETGSVEFTSPENRLDLTILGANDFADIVLNANGLNFINKQGWSQFALRDSHDLTDTAPSIIGDGNVIEFSSAYNTNQSRHPKLTVVYKP